MRAELTDDVLQNARRVADAEMRFTRDRGVAVYHLDGDDLVQTILARTLSGRLRWRFEHVSLRKHLYDLVRHAGRRMRESGRRNVSLDAALDDVEEGLAVDHEVVEALAELADADRDHDLRRLGRDVLIGLDNVVASIGDPDLSIAFNAFVIDGTRGPKAISRVTMLSPVQARRAWRRLRALAVGRLPRQLRADTRAVLGGRAGVSRSAGVCRDDDSTEQ